MKNSIHTGEADTTRTGLFCWVWFGLARWIGYPSVSNDKQIKFFATADCKCWHCLLADYSAMSIEMRPKASVVPGKCGRIMEFSLLGTKVPGENVPDTFALWNFRSLELSLQRAKFSRVFLFILLMFSVLWLGGRKGIQPVKTEWWSAGVVVCLEQGADLHMAQMMPLPLTVSCFSEIQIGFTFLVPAHPGSPGQRTVKHVCCCLHCRWRKWDIHADGYVALTGCGL